MRTKSLLFTAAISAVGMGVALAQAPVYSANVVGYINITAPKGLSLIANQLDNKNGNKLADVISKLPNGAFVHVFNGSGYTSATYFDGFEGADALTLAPGAGAFLEIPADAADADRKITFVGEVLQGAGSNGSVPNGLSILSSKTPRAGKVTTDLKFPNGAALNGSFLYRYSNSVKDYVTSSLFDGWEGDEPTVAVGEAFFFLNTSGSAQAWNQDFTVQ